MGTATIAVLYVLAAELYGATVGLLAGLFLTVNLLHIRDSHYITTDVPLTFLITVALLFVFRYWHSGRRRAALWAGFFAGLAASMKYPGGLVLLPLALAHLLRERPPGGIVRWVASPTMILAGLLAVVGFLIGTPYAVLTPVAFTRGVFSELREVNTVQFGNEADMNAYLFHLLHSFPEGTGVALSLLALAGVVLTVLRHGRREVILLAFPLPYFLVIGSWSSRFERYTLPLLPFLAVLAALALVALVGWLGERSSRWSGRVTPGWWPGLGLAVAGLLLVAPEVVRGIHWHRLLARPDTRAVAGEWIEREIPAEARIAMEPYSPAIRLSRTMVRAERDRLGTSVADAIARHRYDQFLASPVSPTERGYWLLRLNRY